MVLCMNEHVKSRKTNITKILRAFQVYLVACMCFLVARGELFPGVPFRVGKWPENLLIVPFLVTILIVVLERRLGIQFTWREGLLGAFVASVASGLLYSPYPDVVTRGLVQVVTAAILYLLLLHAIRSLLDIKIIVGAFIAGATVTCVVGIAHYFSFGQAGTKTWGYRTYGNFLLMPTSIVLATVIFYMKRWRVLIVSVLVLAVSLAGIFLSQCRGTWLGLVTMMVIASVLGGWRGRLVAGLLILLGFLALFLVPPKTLENQGIVGIVKMNDSMLIGRRRDVWPFAVNLIKERPLLGYGLNTYRRLYEERHGIERPEYRNIIDAEKRKEAAQSYLWKMHNNVHPHNELLQVWTSLGIPGVLLFVACFVAVLKSYLVMGRMKLGGFPAAVRLGIVAWYFGHLATGVFHCFFFFTHAFCAGAVMFALMFGTYYFEKRRAVANDTTSPVQKGDKPGSAVRY